MIPLRVTVELHGSVVEDRLVNVRDSIRLGDSRWADVPFPGADLLIQRKGGQLEVRGRTLMAGVPLSVCLGAVRVVMERTNTHEIERTSRFSFKAPAIDLRVAVATLAVVLTGTFVDAVDRFVQNDPEASELVAELFDPGWADEAEATRRARLQAPGDLPEGVIPDDAFELPVVPAGDGGVTTVTYMPVVITGVAD